MEAVRPKKTKSKSISKQQTRKQRQFEEEREAPPPAVCDEEAPAPAAPTDAEFTDVPLSLPYVGPEEEGELAPPTEPASQAATSTTQTPPQASQASPAPSTNTLSSSALSQTFQSSLTLAPGLSQTDDQPAELMVPPETTVEQRTLTLEQPSAPSAPALYPSLPRLDESLLTQFHEEALRTCRKMGPAVLALAEQESSPPSLQPVELSAPELPRTRLYPELPQSRPEMQAFSLEQLSVWEPAGGLRVWLEGVEVCATVFCSLARQESHELTELLQNYWRCRRQLTQSHTQLHTHTSDCKSTQNRLWSFRDEQLTLQGVCADQSKVCGYHRFQQADFSDSVLAELKRLFDARTELLHQKVALHAYTALLSRLQVESYLYCLLQECRSSQGQPCSLQPLKEAISVLFSFTRRVLDDTQFQTDIHHWLERLV